MGLAVSAPVATAAEVERRPTPVGKLGVTSLLPASKARPGAEIERLRTRYTQTFAAKGGSYETHVAKESLHYRDAAGAWQPIDNALRTEGGVLRNGANRYQLQLPRTLGGGAVRVVDGEAWVEFTPRGVAGRAARARGAEASFAGAWPGVELRYSATGDSVKEELVVADRASVRDFSFDVRVPLGYELVRQRGSIAILDGTGSVRMRLSPSVMIDAGGRTREISTELRRGLGGWVLTLVPDLAWLDQPERTWPVVVDPTVTFGTDEPNGPLICQIFSAGPYGGTCDAPLPYAVGEDTVSDMERVFVRFDLANVLPPGAFVEYAAIESGTAAAITDLTMLEMNVAWNEQIDRTVYDGSNYWTNSCCPDVVSGEGDANPDPIDVTEHTDLVRRWVDGTSPNHGVMLMKKNTPSYARPTVNPVLTIQYSPTDDPEGVQRVAADAYMELESIALQEALRRLAIQDRVENVADDLEDAIDVGDFGGLWFDDASGGRAKIGIETNDPEPPNSKIEDAVEVLEEHDLTSVVDFVAVANSADELEEASDEIDEDVESLLEDSKIALSINVQTNSVEVEKANSLTTPETADLNAAIAAVDVNVTVIPVDAATVGGEPTGCDSYEDGTLDDWPTSRPRFLAYCDLVLRGGVRFTPSGCTIGFYARGINDPEDGVGENRTGKLYALTAGHCLLRPDTTDYFTKPNDDPGSIQIGQRPEQWGYQNGPGDFGVIEIQDRTLTTDWHNTVHPGWIFFDETPNAAKNDNYAIHGVGRTPKPQRGQNFFRCHTSGIGIPFADDGHTECGRVGRLGFKYSGYKNLATVSYCGWPGSSGGPVFKNHIAYGLQQGASWKDKENKHEGCTRGLFQGLKAAETALGVRVVTGQ